MLFDYYLQILCLPKCLGGYESKGRISFTNLATTSEPISLPLSILIMDLKSQSFTLCYLLQIFSGKFWKFSYIYPIQRGESKGKRKDSQL